MNPYYPFLELVFGHRLCTRFHLEHLEHGKHKTSFEECLRLGYITSCGKNENGDDLYCLHQVAKKLLIIRKDRMSKIFEEIEKYII